MLEYPNIDPVIFEIGPLVIRWYAVAYIAGILLGWWLIKKINLKPTPAQPTALMNEKALDDITLYAILGIILGGRIGYVVFYNAAYYLQHPLEALMIWQGGMSFHGGLLGMIMAMWIFAKRFGISYLRLMDMIAVVAPIGLFFGRIANFINGELWGRVTDVPWAMVFPGAGPFPRHPSQLYEAAMEGVVLFTLLLFLALRTNIRDRVGALSGLFLIGYATARSIGELFREPNAHIGFLWGGITMGQALSFPMIAIGLLLLWNAFCRPACKA